MNTSTKTHVASCLILGLAVSTCFAAGEIVIKPYRTGAERRLDNPVDAWMNAWSGAAGKEVKGPEKRKGDLRRYEVLSDDAKNGDFSITFTVENPKQQSAFGFTCGKYIDRWEAGSGAALHLWLKLDATGDNSPVKVALYDTAGKQAGFPLTPRPVDKTWREVDVPLTQFTAADGFDFKSLRSVQVEAKLPKGARIWLDDLYFHEGDSHLGISDKTITQNMAEVAATRARRAEFLLRQDKKAVERKIWGQYYRGELDAANRAFQDFLTQAMDPANAQTTSYNLSNPLYGHVLPDYYIAFSSKGRCQPNRLSPAVEQLLLKAMKTNDLLVNDIAIARHSTWYIVESENHDYNKTKALLFSQMFMHEPEYAAAIYPDAGTALGFIRKADMGMETRLTKSTGALPIFSYAVSENGNYSDGKKYNARDHYQAWVKYWKEYMAERARCGFFQEQSAHATYGLCAPENFTKLYNWVEDEGLRKEASMFLDLMYAKWLQDQLVLIQGGAATRGEPGTGGTFWMAASYCMGSDAELPLSLLLSDYQWPRAVWEMALDRQGKGEYAYVSRNPDEDQDIYPRPEGTSNTMLLRPDSRIVRYSWVTPDYVLGLRMDYPSALYCHNFISAQGITFSTAPKATIQINPGLAYRAVQDRNVALAQQKHYVSIQNMPRFRNYKDRLDKPSPVEVSFGKGVDLIEEKEGWVFAQVGKAYAAFRIVSPASMEPLGRDARGFALMPIAKDNYLLKKDDDGTTLTAKQPMDPLVVEMSRQAHHATLADFEKDVLNNPLVLKTQSQFCGYLLTYRGCGPDAIPLRYFR